MSYFSDATHQAVIADVTGFLPGLYSRTRTVFMKDLGPDIAAAPEPLLKLAFVTILAFDMKPYGNSNPETLADCLTAPNMNCDNYCVFAAELGRVLNEGDPNPNVVGWNGGAVGNHAQLLATFDHVDMLLDPTVGLVVLGANLDSLCRGVTPGQGRWKSFFSYTSDRGNIATFASHVRDAVANGRYMASDLLYFVPNIDKLRTLGGSSAWATPQSWNIT